MLSHDLAQQLLARRNNDVRVQVLVELRDQDLAIDPDLNGQPVVTYDHGTDVIVIHAGVVVLTDGDDDTEPVELTPAGLTEPRKLPDQ